jgi:hypothetical protein
MIYVSERSKLFGFRYMTGTRTYIINFHMELVQLSLELHDPIYKYYDILPHDVREGVLTSVEVPTAPFAASVSPYARHTKRSQHQEHP